MRAKSINEDKIIVVGDLSPEERKQLEDLGHEIVGPEDMGINLDEIPERKPFKLERPYPELSYVNDDTPKWARGRKVEPVRSTPKIGRNEPCHCGSGKKYKNCCLRVDEYGGAGYSYSGGSSIFPRNRGGQMNRGGFGGASNLGGPNMMYTYEIKALNRTLQPLIPKRMEHEEIALGNDIKGYEVNKKNGDLKVGPLMKIETAPDGSLKYYVILDPETNVFIKIDPTTALLVSKTDGVDPTETKEEKEKDKSKPDSPDWGDRSGIYNNSREKSIKKESFYPELKEAYEQGEAHKRTLTRKSKLGFGKFGNETIQKLLDMKKTGYLRWVYYNIAPINFFPDILEEIGIIGDDFDYQISKPGIDKELGDKLFQERNQWKDKKKADYFKKRYHPGVDYKKEE